MRKTSKLRDANVEISLIPLVDIFLNILIFFLVATSFQTNSALNVKLPETRQKGTQEKKKEPMRIELGSDGAIALNKENITLAVLREKLNEQNDKSISVTLRADTKVSHGNVVSILDLLREEGYENLAIMTQTKIR